MSEKKEPFKFSLEATDPACDARAGSFTTPHGTIQTPVFMPVGTQATVKTMSPDELKDCNADIILANTYHLHLRPSSEVIKEAGGLHKFENWDRAILTDSGGFQVFSLKEISKITDNGVTFQSHIDGSKHLFSPETVMEIEHNLGADIIMIFDECPPSDADPKVIQNAVRRTLDWAVRCKEAHNNLPFHFGYPQALFSIVQGGTIKELRQKCAKELVAMDFPGYAIGGLAVGESAEEMYSTIEHTAPLLPTDKPRYLMGVGKPENILESIERGIDMFDCVMPTRNARNGSIFTWNGKINIKNAKHRTDFDNALDNSCTCYACKNFSRGYLRHLYIAGEILALRLLTIHNIHFYIELVNEARKNIILGNYPKWKRDVLLRMGA